MLLRPKVKNSLTDSVIFFNIFVREKEDLYEEKKHKSCEESSENHIYSFFIMDYDWQITFDITKSKGTASLHNKTWEDCR